MASWLFYMVLVSALTLLSGWQEKHLARKKAYATYPHVSLPEQVQEGNLGGRG